MEETSDIERRVRESAEITEFQRRVYLALLQVPKGETISYKELGERKMTVANVTGTCFL